MILPLLAIWLAVDPPKPIGPTPSARQLDWHRLETYAFIHFGLNTFTDREWGEGREDPELFQPSALDCRQWVDIFRDAGMKGVVITAKHHDGFCLWPSRWTDHSVESTSWRKGRGDVLRELAAACREAGLKLGVYLSPWDRHEPSYGDSPRYNEHFRKQLAEVLTGYGEIFEVWFDGACGEGPNGKRQAYDWPGFVATVREHQPGAVIFSDAGPDVRWVGNERGFADPTNWCLLRRDELEPGTPRYRELTSGHADGTHWVPAEADVSIRPGWFYHPTEDAKVKSVAELLEIYYGSVGRNSALLLNVPPDRRGLIHETDAERLREWRRVLGEIFAEDLAAGMSARASNTRGDDERFAPARAFDGDLETYWASEDGVTEAILEVGFEKPTLFDHVVIQEHVALGQRVEAFAIEALQGSEWSVIAEGTTIGWKRIQRVPATEASAVRLAIRAARACPTIASFALYLQPFELREAVHFVQPPEPGLRFAYVEGEWSSVADITFDEPKSRGEVDAFDLSVAEREEKCALELRGFVKAPRDGPYVFSSSSDDGSRLWIGKELVVDNDGLHGVVERSGRIGLKAGWHPIRVVYFNHSGDRGLEVRWEGPGIARATVPPNALAH